MSVGPLMDDREHLIGDDHRRALGSADFQCPACTEHLTRCAALLEEREAAERRIRILERQLAKARAELSRQTTDDPKAKEAREIFDLWNREVKNGRAREFKGKRQENVVARLNANWTLTDFKWAIYGALRRPNVRNGVAYDDLELIARDASTLQSFVDRGKAARAEELARERAA